jgi:hypothetical protein
VPAVGCVDFADRLSYGHDCSFTSSLHPAGSGGPLGPKPPPAR